MIQRGGGVSITMLENVKQKTIAPLIQSTIAPGTLVYTDEYNIYNRLPSWGYEHKTVCHSQGEYARDEDGDGFHEVHVTRWKGFGHSYVPGYVLIEVSPRNRYPTIVGSSSLYIT